MIKVVKKKLLDVIKRQGGAVLPAVIAMFVVGSLLIVPSINYMSTNLRASSAAEEEFMGISAADAGVEDALWKIKYDTPTSFPYEYDIDDVNGLSVDVTIDDIDTIAGEPVGDPEHHAEWLIVTSNVTYNYSTGNYTYMLSATDNGSGNIKVLRILISFPAGVDYVIDSTSSNLTKTVDEEPSDIIGSSSSGITIVWTGKSDKIEGTDYHSFKLSGPPDIEGIEGHGIVEVQREDIGAVWIGDIAPYSIIAEARDASGAKVAAIRAGVWGSSQLLDISCWQVLR